MIDRELETRVWQRIRGKESFGEDLKRLLRLSRMQREDLKSLDRELYCREGIVLGLLAGLEAVSAGEHRIGGDAAPRGENRQQRIRRCRDRCGEMLNLCVRLEQHPRYGAVFTDLARYLRADCALLEQGLTRER